MTLPVEIIRLFKQYFHLNLLDIWGQTETVSHATASPIDGSGPIGASGQALPCWEMKIFNENDHELPPGEEGEIVMRGPVMTEFYNKPEATAAVMRNGWLHTGDLGWMDESGNLFITVGVHGLINKPTALLECVFAPQHVLLILVILMLLLWPLLTRPRDRAPPMGGAV